MIYAEIEYVKELNRPAGVSRKVLSRHVCTEAEPWKCYRVVTENHKEWYN